MRESRTRAIVITAAVLVVGFMALSGFSALWTDRLWFDSVGYSGVFSTVLWTRVALFAVFGAVMALIVAGTIVVAYRVRPMFRPASQEQNNLQRYRDQIEPLRWWLLGGVAAVVALFAGAATASSWSTYQLWRHGGSFGYSDPYFGKDAGFYIFDLPWYHLLTDFGMAAMAVSTVVAAVTHYLYGGIRLQSPGNRLTGAAQVHLSVMVGLFMAVKAVDYWLDRFDLVHQGGGLFSGIAYKDDHAVIPAKSILIWITVLCAVLFFINVWRRSWMLPATAVALLALSAILIGLLWPATVQQFEVSPSEADKERVYIGRNIEATRVAYDLEDTQVINYPAVPDVDPQRLAVEAITSPGIRLIDPVLAHGIFENRQQVRGYYTTSQVLDVDHYKIDGRDRDVVLSVRDIDQDGVPAAAKNWANLHTVYTHGYGVVAAYGNQRDKTDARQLPGDPVWAEEGIPPTGDLTDSTGGYEGRIYFGEHSPAYSIVGKANADDPDIELDLPGSDDDTEADQNNTYDGAAGVDISSTLHQLLFAMKFGDANLLLSGRVHSGSKILYNRNPADMVEKVAPWLTLDSDPYPTIVDGKVLWVLDGFTTTNRFPGSERDSLEEMTKEAQEAASPFAKAPTDEINYMRNAVKATVDAYDGTVTLYAWDESDPILKAWRAIFPGTVKDKADIPADLLSHLRYPEDLFKVQRYQLARYHVTDPDDFYQHNDEWEVPTDPYVPGFFQSPYRLTVKTQDDKPPVFSLTSVFTPTKRTNIASFVSVDGDASKPGYGTMRVLRLGSTSATQGPNAVASTISNDEGVRQKLQSYTVSSSSKVLYGNLLTLPIGGGLMYVQPLYVQRNTSDSTNFPVLNAVAVSFGATDEAAASSGTKAVGVGDTLEEAVHDLLGITDSGPIDPVKPPKGDGSGDPNIDVTLPAQVLKLLNQAKAKYAEADAALADGDTVGWAQATAEAQALVERAVALANSSK